MESFAPSRLEAAALYEELLERKLVDPTAASYEHYPTEDGSRSQEGKCAVARCGRLAGLAVRIGDAWRGVSRGYRPRDRDCPQSGIW